MKRRNFTQSMIAALGVSSLPVSVSLASQSISSELQMDEKITADGELLLKLNSKVHPTRNKDQKQYILTYDVENARVPLEEKIYNLTASSGKTYEVFMTPVNENQLQAVFNRRLNA